MRKIFISHASLDNNKMKALEKELVNNGFDPIVIVNRRDPRQLFSTKVKNGIDQSDYMIPILTENSIISQWVNQEIGYAEAKNKIVFPIIAKNVLNKLKGFIHREEEHFVFQTDINQRKEASQFRKIYLELIQHIIELESLKIPLNVKIKDNYMSAIASDYKPIDIPFEYYLRKGNKLVLLVKTTNKNQTFNAYYQIETKSGEKKWLKFTNKPIGSEYVSLNEHVIHFDPITDNSYKIVEDIYRRVYSAFPEIKIPKNRISIKKFRFRGDKNDNNPIHFYFRIQ